MYRQLIANSIISGSSYSLFAASFGLIHSTARFLPVAHAAIYTIAAYILLFGISSVGLPAPVFAMVAIVVAAGVGALIEVGVYHPLRRRGSPAGVLLISSLGVLVILQNIVSMAFGDATRSVSSGGATEGLAVFGARITAMQCVVVIGNVIVMLCLRMLLRHTKWGTLVRAVASDPSLSEATGINVRIVFLSVFWLASACGAIGAALDSYNTDLVPAMGFKVMLGGLVAAIVGGMGSVPGALLGGLLIGIAQQIGAWKLSNQWQDLVVFSILLFFLLLRPQGIFGKPLRQTSV